MKVVSYLHQGRHGVGVVTGAKGLIALAKAAPDLPDDLRQILEIDPTLAKVRAATTPHGSCPAITGPDTLPSPSEAAPPEAR